MNACESDRGEWGEVCPDCGQRLPARQGPMSTWMASRNRDEVRAANARRSAPAAMRIKYQPRARAVPHYRRAA